VQQKKQDLKKAEEKVETLENDINQLNTKLTQQLSPKDHQKALVAGGDILKRLQKERKGNSEINGQIIDLINIHLSAENFTGKDSHITLLIKTIIPSIPEGKKLQLSTSANQWLQKTQEKFRNNIQYYASDDPSRASLYQQEINNIQAILDRANSPST
jgi:hypothetical protein